MTLNWQADSELFTMMKDQLFSAVLGDILDQMGLVHQFLPAEIMPLETSMLVAGRAMPVLLQDIGGESGTTGKPFGLMLEALDDLKPYEVYLASGGSPNYALWGELMSTRAIKLEAAGAVLNGYSRDTDGILELGFPTFSYGCYAQDQAPRGEVIDFRVNIKVGSVSIQPGDIIFGDRDGVLVIPNSVEQEVIEGAIEKVQGENLVRKAIQNGMSACEAFEKYGIM